MTPLVERLDNTARCCADACAEAAHVIDPDRPLVITVAVQTLDGNHVAEAVAFSDHYRRPADDPIASRKAPEPPLPVADEYAPATSHEMLYELADTVTKQRKERV